MAANQPTEFGKVKNVTLGSQDNLATNLATDKTEPVTATNVAQYLCGICKAVFFSHDDMTAHIQIHKDDFKDKNDDNDDNALRNYGMEEILDKMDVEIEGEIHTKNPDSTDGNNQNIIILSIKNASSSNPKSEDPEFTNTRPSSAASSALKPAKTRRKKQTKTSDLTKYTGMLEVMSEDFTTSHKEIVESLENFGKHMTDVLDDQFYSLNGLSLAKKARIKSAVTNLENLAEYLTEELTKQTTNLENFKESMKDKLESIVTKLKDMIITKKIEKRTNTGARKNRPTILTYASTCSTLPVDAKVLTHTDSVLSNLGSEDKSTKQGSNCDFDEANTDDPEDSKDQLLSEENVVSQSPSPIKKAKKAKKAKRNSDKQSEVQSEVGGAAEKKEDQPRCDVCERVFASKSALTNHMKKHGIQHLTTCPICGKDAKKQLTAHMRTHTGERPYECNVCGKRFRQSGHLNVHLESHNTERRHQCEHCGKSYKARQYLLDHMRCHIDTMPHVCEICGKGYVQKSEFDRHMMVHEDLKCVWCDISFEGGKEFEAHNLEVHGKKTPEMEKPVVCEFCGKKIRRNYLIDHMRIHTGLRPYKCKVCDRTFIQGAHLRTHMLTHTGERPHKCTFCGKGFALKRNLQDHLRLHTGERPFACKICDRSFNHRNNLKKHVSTVHGLVNVENLTAVPIASFDDEHDHEDNAINLPNQECTALNLYSVDDTTVGLTFTID